MALIAGFGEAAELWSRETDQRWIDGVEFRQRLLAGIAPLNPVVNASLDRSLPFILNVSIPGTDSESVMSAWSDLAAVSSGAACSSQSYTCSHVLAAMGIAGERSAAAIRFSWCPLSEMPDCAAMVAALGKAEAS